MSQRRIAVVTVGRSDYGIYLPMLRAIQAHPDLKLEIIAAGMHLAPQYGRTVQLIEADGFDIVERIEMLLASDTPGSLVRSMGVGLLGYASLFDRYRPDVLVVLGDRFDMYAAALAALPYLIPVAHIHGGEITEGALDDALRHSLTKLAHLHFVSTPDYARRVMQLGEEPWRVHVSGAPALDNLALLPRLPEDDLKARFGLRYEQPPLLVTYHPVTLDYQTTGAQVEALLAALDAAGRPTVFTLPNADTHNQIIASAIRAYVQAHADAAIVENFGAQAYFSMMHYAAAMVGNSSSGILEAASFGLPVVNIGSRQRGRVRGANVIDCEPDAADIRRALDQALSPAFRESLRGLQNPYQADQPAAQVISSVLAAVALDERLLHKRFHTPSA